jgi:hypothetical protein
MKTRAGSRRNKICAANGGYWQTELECKAQYLFLILYDLKLEDINCFSGSKTRLIDESKALNGDEE